jgi:hypothetical protein
MPAAVKPATTHELRRPRQRVGGICHGVDKTLGRQMEPSAAGVGMEGAVGR